MRPDESARRGPSISGQKLSRARGGVCQAKHASTIVPAAVGNATLPFPPQDSSTCAPLTFRVAASRALPAGLSRWPALSNRISFSQELPFSREHDRRIIPSRRSCSLAVHGSAYECCLFLFSPAQQTPISFLGCAWAWLQLYHTKQKLVSM